MPHIHPTTSPKGGNTGSCAGAIQYLEKENQDKDLMDREQFFNNDKDIILSGEAISIVDPNKQGMKKDDAKFYSMTYSFSEQELEGRTDDELKQFVKDNFTKDYAGSVKGRDIDPDTIQYVAKLEYERAYKGTDQAVKDGIVSQGDKKPGDNRHIHVLVSRKTTDNKKISPLTNHRNEGKGSVKSGFDRIGFKEQTEKSFDKHFEYERPLEQKYEYLRANEEERDVLREQLNEQILAQQEQELEVQKLQLELEEQQRLYEQEREQERLMQEQQRNMSRGGR